MSESPEAIEGPTKFPKTTLAAAALVLVLALGAAFFPSSKGYEMQEVFLVFDAPGSGTEREEFFHSLAQVLGEISEHSMEVVVCTTRGEFMKQAQGGVDFLFCPDGLALELDPAKYAQMAVGRRRLPSNLRPRGVTVFRKSVGKSARPWESHAKRTVFGDSISLVSVGPEGPVMRKGECAFGPDPYNHAPALHALRLGAFDFALVRQWEAEEFFASGLLDPNIWGVHTRTVPVPDMVVMASTMIPLVDRLKWADTLALVGRSEGETSEPVSLLQSHLGALGLVGFNILLEPDFELVRRNFTRNWPGATD